MRGPRLVDRLSCATAVGFREVKKKTTRTQGVLKGRTCSPRLPELPELSCYCYRFLHKPAMSLNP